MKRSKWTRDLIKAAYTAQGNRKQKRRYGPTDLRMDIIDTSLVILNVRCVCGYVTLCLGPFCCPPSSWHCFLQVCVCVFYCVSDFRRSLSLQHFTAISLFLAARATVHACVPARASACVCVLLTLVIVALLSLQHRPRVRVCESVCESVYVTVCVFFAIPLHRRDVDALICGRNTRHYLLVFGKCLFRCVLASL